MAGNLEKARAQLTEAMELLELEPNDEELKSLVEDLRQQVSLAEALVASTREEEGPKSSGWVTASSSSAGGRSGISRSQTPEHIDLLPGRRCEVKSKDMKRWQAGVVLKRLPDFEYVVQRLHDSQEVNVKGTDEIREIVPQDSPIRHDSLVPGLTVRARYSGDGKFYQAVVDKRTEHGCMVIFEGYEDDDPEHVALEHVRLPELGEAPSLLAPVEIPPHLVVKSDDSEDVKASKLRQQKALRRRVRQETIDQVHEHKQNNWIAFQASNKRMKGALTTVGGTSVFQLARNDPDARLGVVKHTGK